MLKVLASSATMGTMRELKLLTLSSPPRIRTAAVVVESPCRRTPVRTAHSFQSKVSGASRARHVSARQFAALVEVSQLSTVIGELAEAERRSILILKKKRETVLVGVTCNMSAEITVCLVRSHDHHQRIPAHDRGQSFFEREIPRITALPFQRNGVAICRKRLRQTARAAAAQCIFQLGTRNCPRSGPYSRNTASSASSHSRVSTGS